MNEKKQYEQNDTNRIKKKWKKINSSNNKTKIKIPWK